MEREHERRTEHRLRYYWPIWFAENFDHALSQGQMVDVCSKGAAFTCYAHDGCPYPGQHIAARFSVPRYGSDDSFDMANFTRWGYVCRVENVNSFIRRVAIQFSEPLPFKPGEQADNESKVEATPEPVLA